MQNIVIDTSVVISALIGKAGPSRKVLRKCFEQEYLPLINNTLFCEYSDVTSRADIIERCPIDAAEVNDFLNGLYLVSKWVNIHFLWRPNLLDENDNFLIELAVAGNADFIITNNLKDLKNAQLKFDSFLVLSPEEFLKRGF